MNPDAVPSQQVCRSNENLFANLDSHPVFLELFSLLTITNIDLHDPAFVLVPSLVLSLLEFLQW